MEITTTTTKTILITITNTNNHNYCNNPINTIIINNRMMTRLSIKNINKETVAINHTQQNHQLRNTIQSPESPMPIPTTTIQMPLIIIKGLLIKKLTPMNNHNKMMLSVNLVNYNSIKSLPSKTRVPTSSIPISKKLRTSIILDKIAEF